MAAILPEAIGTGTEWMNGYRQAQREDKAELDRLRAELTSLQLKYDNSIHHGCTQYEIDRLRAENEKLRLMPDDNREQLFKVTAMAAQLNEENERLREAIRQYAGEINATQETDPDILRRMIEIERAQATEIQASLSNELDRLRAENERLVGIIANVCLALGYEESAWPAHWRPPPDPSKETEE